MEDKIVTLIGGDEIIKSFNTDNSVTLRNLETWNDLTNKQQNYLSAYVDSTMQVASARIRTMTKRSELAEWYKQPQFVQAIEDIEALFAEGLRSIDYQEAITNSKIRGRVLQSHNAKGYERKENIKNNTNNVLITSPQGLAGLSEALKKLGSSS